MRVKPRPRLEEVESIKGLSSRELADRCPDAVAVFPAKPCTNGGCPWAIKSRAYMNCSFVAFEAVERSPGRENEGLSLEEIAETMGLTREGVRLIQVRGLKKLMRGLDSVEEPDATAVHEPLLDAGQDRGRAEHQVAERPSPHRADVLHPLRRRRLG